MARFLRAQINGQYMRRIFNCNIKLKTQRTFVGMKPAKGWFHKSLRTHTLRVNILNGKRDITVNDGSDAAAFNLMSGRGAIVVFQTFLTDYAQQVVCEHAKRQYNGVCGEFPGGEAFQVKAL